MITQLLALALAFAGMNAALSYALWVSPLPKNWKVHAYHLYSDAITINILVFSVSLVQILVSSLAKILSVNLTGPMQVPTLSFTAIMAQLGSLLGGILAVMAVCASAGLGSVSSMLGLAGNVVTGSMMLWSIIFLAINLILKFWILLYVVGIVFYSVPFRLTRKIGSTLMASSCVLVVGLPLLPDFALMLEWTIGFQPVFESFMSRIQKLDILTLLPPYGFNDIISAVFQMLSGLFIALIIFPMIYLWILSKVTRRLSELIGGYSGELDLSRWIS
ncbi:MAG: hypothetical protein QXS01_04325 [Candidatus Bathyarchaeia archaeon]